MFARTVSRCALTITLGCIAVFLGCGEPVREDRQITFSKDGDSVALQHGNEGVFVAGSDGDKLEKIFDPGADAVAVSPPLWAPDDQRMIFTVARRDPDDASHGPIEQLPDWNATPQGRTFNRYEVIYECWLREAPRPTAAEAAIADAARETPAIADAPVAEPTSPKLQKLFTARCMHPGYVAANLAVRWHPDGSRVLFVDRVDSASLSLFEFRLDDHSRRQVLDQPARDLVFGFSPQRNYLHCVTTGWSDDETGRIRVQPVGDEISSSQWRTVAGAVPLALGDEPERGLSLIRDLQNMLRPRLQTSPIERLRATEPAWTRDERGFAYATFEPGERDDAAELPIAELQQEGEPTTQRPSKRFPPGIYRIMRFEVVDWSETELISGDRPFRDLTWEPAGGQLAFVEGGAVGTLRMLNADGGTVRDITNWPVRELIGWNATGDKLAYIAQEATVTPFEERWAFLLPPIAAARDAVYVVPLDLAAHLELYDDEAQAAVVSGLRITFPQWSPTEDKLSLWGTFSPMHRSWLSAILSVYSLPPGDPAAVVDGSTGEISWLAVNATEQSQVANYHLLRKEYVTAWEWFKKANAQLPAPRPFTLAEMFEALNNRAGHNNTLFFQAYCQQKLGNRNKARELLAEFRRTFAVDPDSSFQVMLNLLGEDHQIQAARMAGNINQVMQDQYIAEAYLSLDAVEDGIDYFRGLLAKSVADTQATAQASEEHAMGFELASDAEHDIQQLSAALALSQLLLLDGRHEEYVDLSFDTLVPTMARLAVMHDIVPGPHKPLSGQVTFGQMGQSSNAWNDVVPSALVIGSYLALAPLASPEFLATVPSATIARHAEACAALQPAPEFPAEFKHMLNAYLMPSYHVLQQPEKSRAAARMLKSAATEEELSRGILDETAQTIRGLQGLEW